LGSHPSIAAPVGLTGAAISVSTLNLQRNLIAEHVQRGVRFRRSG